MRTFLACLVLSLTFFKVDAIDTLRIRECMQWQPGDSIVYRQYQTYETPPNGYPMDGWGLFKTIVVESRTEVGDTLKLTFSQIPLDTIIITHLDSTIFLWSEAGVENMLHKLMPIIGFDSIVGLDDYISFNPTPDLGEPFESQILQYYHTSEGDMVIRFAQCMGVVEFSSSYLPFDDYWSWQLVRLKSSCADYTGWGYQQNYFSINDEKNAEFSVFPVPCTDILNIQGDGFTEVSISNLSGERLVKATSTTVSVKELPSGFYVLEITDGKNVFKRKIVKL